MKQHEITWYIPDKLHFTFENTCHRFVKLPLFRKREKARVTQMEKQTRAENQQKERVVSNRARGPANRDRAGNRRRGKRAGDQMPYASQQDRKAAHKELEHRMERKN